jgi:probable HAF family extracellular repeat protein
LPLIVLAVAEVGDLNTSQADAPLFHASPWATLPEGSSNVVRALNDTNNAVVSATIAAKSRGYQLSNERGLENLRGLQTTDFTSALGINNRDDIVGTTNLPEAQRAFRATADGQSMELKPLAGDTASAAYAINDTQDSVGYSSGAGGFRAVIWDRNGVALGLPAVTGSTATLALGINSHRVVVGIARYPDHQGAWRSDGTQVELLQNLPGDTDSEALSINSSGIIVGSSGAGPVQRHAVMWNADGSVEALGELQGGMYSRAIAINEKNEVVGTAETRDGSRAFLWTREGGMQDLNDLATLPAGLILTQAAAINNKGTILALGYIDNHTLTPSADGTVRFENHELPLQVVRLTLVNQL